MVSLKTTTIKFCAVSFEMTILSSIGNLFFKRRNLRRVREKKYFHSLAPLENKNRIWFLISSCKTWLALKILEKYGFERATDGLPIKWKAFLQTVGTHSARVLQNNILILLIYDGFIEDQLKVSIKINFWFSVYPVLKFFIIGYSLYYIRIILEFKISNIVWLMQFFLFWTKFHRNFF